MTQDSAQRLTLLNDLITKAKSFGATDADALLADSTSVSVNRRLGNPESISRSEETEIGLRVFVGKKQAIVSSSDLRPETLNDMADRAVAMAKCVPDDPYACLADASLLAKNFPDLELFDPTELNMAQLDDLADATEQAAMDVKGVTNSEGADAGFGEERAYFVASNGFQGSYMSSGFSLSVSVIAGKDTQMETDYAFDSASFFSDLRAPKIIGQEAGTRAVKALHPKKGATKKLPVIFDRRISSTVPGALSNAISGRAVASGTSFLKDRMGEKIFSDGITIVDDPFLKRGARSHPFDGEGLSPQKRNIIENGILQGWLLDIASAKQLGLQSTGNATRGTSSPPSPRPSNFYLMNGTKTAEELISEIEEGFYVTQFLGSGGSVLTGDYSRGARGFWIEKGQITHAVSEMTIAGNMKDMWLNITAANDLDIRYGTDAPTLRIDGMTIAGS